MSASTKIEPRSVKDFLTFCQVILEYENYKGFKEEEQETDVSLDSGDSFLSESFSPSSSEEDKKEVKHEVINADHESWDLITCFCMKPFSGRPMIECSRCQTWIHLSCAKIRKNNIPDEFVCHLCRQAEQSTRRSRRSRTSF